MGKTYRKTALIELLRIDGSGNANVCNVGNPDDCWVIPADVWEATYELFEEKIYGTEGSFSAEEAIEIEAEFDFGLALVFLKDGSKLARKGWNGKGLFVVYQKGYPDGIPCNKQTADAWGMNEGELFVCNPYLQIKQSDGSHSMWVPSIGDCLSEDWMVVG